jgi:hypothetical protein
MHRSCGTLSAAALCLAAVHAADSPAPVAADFKLVVAFYEAGDKPVWTAELVAHRGIVYQFRADSSEIVIAYPAIARIDLLDLAKKVQTSITFRQLDEVLDRLRRQIASSAARAEAKGGKANLLAAKMSRELIEPKLSATFEPGANRLRLKGAGADVEATGEPDSDTSRLALIGEVMSAIAKLESMREPANIPPFVRLETISAMVRDRHLRPTELSFLYRQAGTPERNRWTYRLVTSLTDREREALARVELLRTKATALPTERYERRGP